MSKSRFILKQARVSGSASSDLTRYVAKHDLNRQREGRGARPLFTERSDDLTFWAARKWLSITNGELPGEDVLHYILSFEHPPDYQNLGADDRARATEIRIGLRRALSQAAKEIGVENLRWAAGIHLNKPHPHVHILLNKHALSRETGDLTRVPKLPRRLVAHYSDGAGGTREFDYGIIINSFAEHIDARLQRERAHVQVLSPEQTRRKERPTLQSDRILLGESMRARHETERLSAQLASFEKRSWQAPEYLSRLEARLDAARKYHRSLQPHVEDLRARYQEQGAPLPLPALSSAEVRKLQAAAIERRDAERIRVLEKIRLELAVERGHEPRDRHERRRLAAQLREAETNLQEHEWRAHEFERSYHLIRFEADGERLSLARIDLRQERARVKISFIHSGITALFPAERQAALGEMAGLRTLRPQVVAGINARRQELQAERERAAETSETLREISVGAARMHEASGPEKTPEAAAPIYSRAELARMSARAHQMHDAGLLLEVHAARRASRERLAPEKREALETLAARSFAHEIVAEADFKEAQGTHAAQAKQGRFTPVAARLANGSIVTGSVRQTEVLTRAEAIIRIIENTPEQRERYAAITRAAATSAAHVRSQFEAAAAYFAAARQVADDYRQELARAGKDLPAPAFTQSELNRLDPAQTRRSGAEAHHHSTVILDRSEQPAPAHMTTRENELAQPRASRQQATHERESQIFQPPIHTR